MNNETAEILCKLNNDFYRNQSRSFSETRQAPWTGWKRCAEILEEAGYKNMEEFSVFDLACGNLRFESFLASKFPETKIVFYAIDDCDDLVEASAAFTQGSAAETAPLLTVEYQSLDILQAAMKGLSAKNCWEAPICDLSVSFGFFHHVPSRDYRKKILADLMDQTRSGGFVIISLWQFLNNESLKEKAQATHERALQELALPKLDENDYLLGWKNIPGAYRYCHSFSEEEIDEIIESVYPKGQLVSRFVTDGRTDNLNTYLVFKVV